MSGAGTRRELIVVQLPRGRTATVHFDPTTGLVTTDHPGIRMTFFLAGVKDLEGRVLRPTDGRRFLVALYDHLLLSGYVIRWVRPVRSLPPSHLSQP